jgi:3-dehydroquinate synthase
VIVITGFMGTGKTAVGKALSEILGLDFVDTDAEIEASAGCSIPEIFESKGEPHFRQMERAYCFSLRERSGLVIATGGGTLLDGEIFDLFSSMGQIVLLEASTDVLARRLSSAAGRPLLRANPGGAMSRPLEARIEALLEARADVYNRIPLRIDTSTLDPPEAAARICASLRLPFHSFELSLSPPAAKAPIEGSEEVHRGREGTARIEIGRGTLSSLGHRLREFAIATRAFVLIPECVRDLYITRIAASLAGAGIPYSVVTIEDGDSRKTLSQAGKVIDALVALGARRDSTIVAVGGGVTGDVAGFVASIYMRGVPLVQIPTTLLAQVDSSIGGKVGVNHRMAKNLIGNFYQPHLVLIDPCALVSLPLEEISNGMAEVVKTAVIGSSSFFEYLEARTADDAGIRLRDVGFLETCILESSRIKSIIVGEDPFELDLRRLLNFGHTAGHAIEASARYRGMKHGRAVSIGMVAALQVARARGVIGKDVIDRVCAVLSWCALPVELGAFDPTSVLKRIRLDKKIKKERIHFVLPTGLGSAAVVDDVSEEEILAALEKGAS